MSPYFARSRFFACESSMCCSAAISVSSGMSGVGDRGPQTQLSHERSANCPRDPCLAGAGVPKVVRRLTCLRLPLAAPQREFRVIWKELFTCMGLGRVRLTLGSLRPGGALRSSCRAAATCMRSCFLSQYPQEAMAALLWAGVPTTSMSNGMAAIASFDLLVSAPASFV